MLHLEVPPFEPHPLLRGGHLQTVGGRYFPGRQQSLNSTYHEILLEDGDRLTVFETTHAAMPVERPTAILVHGLAGSARAPYVVRLGCRLARLGFRVVRMNLRGAGAGFGLARGTYHAGRTADVRSVAQWTAQRAPGSPIALIGFSLGANLVLKLAAEAAASPVEALDCVVAANPPLDLDACCRHMQRPENRFYDQNFLKLLLHEVRRLHARFPDLPAIDVSAARCVYDFDDLYTARRNGFASAADYYERSSAGPLIKRIQVPGLVVHSLDDPFIPAEPFRNVTFPRQVTLELTPSGGHLGYVSRTPWDGDRRWLDARLTAWLVARWGGSVRRDAMKNHDRVTTSEKQGGRYSHA
jgi:predicted alpha/beta-fold hydrolase